MKRTRSKLTYANVMSTIAVFLVLGGGTALAATQMLPKNSVGTKQLKNRAVTAAKLSKAAEAALTGPSGAAGVPGLTGPKGDTGDTGARGPAGTTEPGSVGTVQLADGSVTTPKLANGAVTHPAIGNSAVNSANVANNSLTGADFAGADISGPISLDAGAVGVGRCLNFTPSITGAHVGDTVLVSTRAPLQEGIVLYGLGVPSENAVTLAICNLSGTTQEALSNFPIHVMTFE